MAARIALVLAVQGCASADMAPSAADDASTATTGPASPGSTSDTAEGTADAAPPPATPTPTWWAVDGTWVVLDGVPDTVNSSVWVTAYDADLATLCSMPVTGFDVMATSSPDAAVPADPWWELSPVDDSQCPLPYPLVFALGELDPALLPALDEASLAYSPIDGFYISGPEVVWSAGFAGTTEQLAGTGEASDVPVGDGQWTFSTVVLLPW